MIFNSFNNLLIGYKWSIRVNDKLLQKDISEDHEDNISCTQINLSEARDNFFKNTKAHHAKKDISEALEQFHRKELRWRDVSAAYLASLAAILGLYFILKLLDLSILLKQQTKQNKITFQDSTTHLKKQKLRLNRY